MANRTQCSSFSTGGKYFVTGGTDHILRVYVCIPGPPVLQAELVRHKVRSIGGKSGRGGWGVRLHSTFCVFIYCVWLHL